MKTSAQNKAYKFKAGLFVIGSIALLFLCILWIRYFALGPKMTLIAEFKNPGPLQNGIQSYFKGINVGSVSDVGYSGDFQKSIIYIKIYNKDVDMPSNSYAQIKMEGITGQKYIDIVPPKKPSLKMLANGMRIRGESAVGFAKVTEFLNQEISRGRFDSILANTDELLQNSNEIGRRIIKYANNSKIKDENIDRIILNSCQNLEEIKKLIQNINSIFDDGFDTNIKESAKNFNTITSNISGFFEGTKTGAAASINSQRVKDTTSNLKTLIEDSDRLVKNWNAMSYDLYSDIKRKKLIENISCTFAKIGLTFDEANELLSNIESKGIDKNMKDLIMETLYNTNKTAKKVGCLSDGSSDLLSKRFLLFRLMFGKPGAKLDECNQKGSCRK